jgi:hypothetical protein
LARGFGERLRGLRRSPEDESLLIRTRSVHGFGMNRALLVVGLDKDLRVIGSRPLFPGRMVRMGQARYILELPIDAKPPRRDSVLRVERG